MGLFRRQATLSAADASPDTSGPDPLGAAARGTTSGVGDLQAIYDAATVRRATAMRVPAFRQAARLVGSNLGSLRFMTRTPAGPVDVPPVLRRPDPGRTLSAWLNDITVDLALHGVAYAVNPRWDTPAGWAWPDAGIGKRKHKSLIRVAPENVVPSAGERVQAWDGLHVSEYMVTDAAGVGRLLPAWAVVAFECGAGGWLLDGADTLRTIAALEEAVRAYARSPLPSVVIRNTGPRRSPKQVATLLDEYELARRTRATAYVGRDLDLTTLGFDARQTALVESRRMAGLEVARLTGIPAILLGVVPDGSSMTYQNMTQARLDLLSAIQPYAVAIEQRLAFDDVTGAGTDVVLDFGPWLRVDPSERARLYSQMIPVGVLTVDEARGMEDLAPTGTPTAGQAAAS